jgi:hypothetical protein
VDERTLDKPIETELTLAARGSVDNASQITQADDYSEGDFRPEREEQIKEAKLKGQRKKARKAERKRKSVAKKKKRK